MKLLRALLALLRGTSAASAVAHVALTNGVVLCLNVLTGILTARLLGPAGRGELAALLLWPQFLAQAFVLALPSATLFHIRKHPEASAGLAGCALLLSLASGLLAMTAGILAMPLLLANADPQMLENARWMMLFTPFGTVTAVLSAMVQVEGRFHFYNFARYAPLVLTVLALGLLHLSGRLDPVSGALVYYLPGIPVFALMLWTVLRNFRPRPTLAHARRLLSYAARAFGGEAAGTLLSHLDKLVLVNLLSLSAYGVYVVVFNLSRVIVTMGSSIVPVLLSRTAGREAADVLRSTERALDVTTPMLLVAALGLAAFGGFVLRLLYGEQFAQDHLALGLLSFEAVLFSLAYVLAQPFLALNRPGVATLVQLSSVLVIAPCMWLLAPWGVAGAALALLLTTLFRTAATRMAFGVFPDERPPRIVPDLRSSLAWLRSLRGAT